ncbi:hypothetical protein G3M83_09260 [Rouxiella badensis]|uniref:hypothetical protein n=1 Tax=Rouxiella badensis TaxID=1646377 RepID=UPI0013EF08C8|nr:hypothetical protein [Rouxiella badensis]QII37872.1 hypothetical protein G3M83_09260 [Rouxiella badensis]
MSQERDYQQISRLAGVRTDSEMRRLFGTGWKTINTSQRAWIRHLLTVWGDHYSGEEGERGEINLLGRLMMRCEWIEQQAKQIEKVYTRLHCEGLRGDELLREAKNLLLPNTSAGNIIALAKESDDAAFIEAVIVKTFGRENPIRYVARLRYCRRKSAQNLMRALSYHTGITSKEARNRMEWAERMLEGELFYAVNREMEKESLLMATQ